MQAMHACQKMQCDCLQLHVSFNKLQLMEEMRLILGKTEKEMEVMFSRAKDVMKALWTMVPKEYLKHEVRNNARERKVPLHVTCSS